MKNEILLGYKIFFAFSVRHISEYAYSILPITEILSCWKKKTDEFIPVKEGQPGFLEIEK